MEVRESRLSLHILMCERAILTEFTSISVRRERASSVYRIAKERLNPAAAEWWTNEHIPSRGQLQQKTIGSSSGLLLGLIKTAKNNYPHTSLPVPNQWSRQMHMKLDPEEIESLIEGLDCLKTKIAFTKGLSSAEKNEKIIEVQALELKLSSIESGEITLPTN